MILFIIIWLFIGFLSLVSIYNIVLTQDYKIVWKEAWLPFVFIFLGGPITPIIVLLKLWLDD